MSNEAIASELLMKTPIVNVLPTLVALKVSGTCGQLLLVTRVRQTTPVRTACTGCVERGNVRTDARIKTVIATTRFI